MRLRAMIPFLMLTHLLADLPSPLERNYFLFRPHPEIIKAIVLLEVQHDMLFMSLGLVLYLLNLLELFDVHHARGVHGELSTDQVVVDPRIRLLKVLEQHNVPLL